MAKILQMCPLPPIFISRKPFSNLPMVMSDRAKRLWIAALEADATAGNPTGAEGRREPSSVKLADASFVDLEELRANGGVSSAPAAAAGRPGGRATAPAPAPVPFQDAAGYSRFMVR